jgi:D-erythronate 2-dehydrogenase
MEILITGGAGFLGQQLIARLLAQRTLRLHDAGGARDETVDRIVCFDQGEGAIRDARVRNVAGDISDPAQTPARSCTSQPSSAAPPRRTSTSACA